MSVRVMVAGLALLAAAPAQAQDQDQVPAPAPASTPAPAPAPPPPFVWMDGYDAPIAETFLVERVEISPDGASVAYVAALGDERRLRVQALDGSLSRTADLKRAPLRDLMWAGDDRVILLMGYDRLDFVPEDNAAFVGVAFNARTNSWETLLRNRTEVLRNWLGDARLIKRAEDVFPLIFERPIVRTEGARLRVFLDAIETNNGDIGYICRYNLYETDLDVGSTDRISRGVNRRQARVVGPDNRLWAVMQDDGLKMSAGAGWRPRPVEGGAPLELLGLGQTAGTVLVRTGAGGGARLWEVPLAAGEQQPVTVGDLTDPQPIYDDAGVLIGFEGRRPDGAAEYSFIEHRLAAVWGGVVAAFPGDRVQLASWSADYGKLVVYAERPGSADFHLVDVAARTSVFLAPSFPEPQGALLDRTGNFAARTIRRAAAARIEDPSRLCWPPPG